MIKLWCINRKESLLISPLDSSDRDLFLEWIAEAPVPLNVILSIHHATFVKGDHTNFEIEESFGAEATELYPDVKYTTVDEYLNRFLW